MIYLRSITDESGDTVDLAWYCSHVCYSASLASEPPSETFERGGAYPCGAESDSPDACAHCGDPVGNPITDYGVSTVEDWLDETAPSKFALACASIYGLETPCDD